MGYKRFIVSCERMAPEDQNKLILLQPHIFTTSAVVVSLGMIVSSMVLMPCQDRILDRFTAACLAVCALVLSFNVAPAAFPFSIENATNHCLYNISQRVLRFKKDPFCIRMVR